LYKFHKSDIPEEENMKIEFAEKLESFGISLQQYISAFKMDNLTM